MFIAEPLLRLPLRFDPTVLSREIDELPPEAWTDHPQGYRGNDAVRFVTVNGLLSDDIGSPMAPTRWLESCPYVKTVMGALDAVWGRCRLMRLAPGAIVPPHVDVDFYWRTHVRIHVPVVTNSGVRFTVSNETVHMAAGEVWVFDTFSRHTVHNDSSEGRTHLVLDTIGGEGFSQLIAAAQEGSATPRNISMDDTPRRLAFERHSGDAIMSPWELTSHIAFLRARATPSSLADFAFDRLELFASAWHGLWAQFDDPTEALPSFGRLIATLGADFSRLGDLTSIQFGNEIGLEEVMAYFVRALIRIDLMPVRSARKLPRTVTKAVC